MGHNERRMLQADRIERSQALNDMLGLFVLIVGVITVVFIGTVYVIC